MMSGIWRCGCGELILHGYSQCWQCGTVMSEEGRLEGGKLVSPESMEGASPGSPEPAARSVSGKAPSAPASPKPIRRLWAELGVVTLFSLIQCLPVGMELFASGVWYVTVFTVTGRIWPLIAVHAAFSILWQM